MYFCSPQEREGRGERLAGEIFESLRPAQDIHLEAEKAGRVEDKEPEKVEESGAHETEVNLRKAIVQRRV